VFRYLAPEWYDYADGSISYRQKSPKSLDVYAAAVIFWEVGSHKFAFGDPAHGPTTGQRYELRQAVDKRRYRPTPQLDVTVFTQDVCDLIAACWDPEPDNRPTFEGILVSPATPLLAPHASWARVTLSTSRKLTMRTLLSLHI
jgi:hypothetical protein